MSLQDAIGEEQWRVSLKCYLYVIIGLSSATRTNWVKVQKCLEALDELKPSPDSSLGIIALYLRGVYNQGTGVLDEALAVFESPSFAMEVQTENFLDVAREARLEVSILAALNRLLIMQHDSYKDVRQTAELAEQMRQVCAEHPNKDIVTAYNIVKVAIQVNPPLPMNQVKRHLNVGLKGAQDTNNIFCLAIILNLMKSKIFDNLLGEQGHQERQGGRRASKAQRQSDVDECRRWHAGPVLRGAGPKQRSGADARPGDALRERDAGTDPAGQGWREWIE